MKKPPCSRVECDAEATVIPEFLLRAHDRHPPGRTALVLPLCDDCGAKAAADPEDHLISDGGWRSLRARARDMPIPCPRRELTEVRLVPYNPQGW